MTTTLLEDNSPSLWMFTLDRYAEPGVQRAAMALQEKLDADVNLLFYCAWYAASGRGRLDKEEIERAEMQVARWRDEVTVPLRRLRNYIKADPALKSLEGAVEVREKILGAEIESEHVNQILIESMSRPPAYSSDGTQRDTAEHNLRTYLAYIGANLDTEFETHLYAFMSGVFSDN